MTEEITYPIGTAQQMMKFTAGGIVLGLGFYGALMMGSAYLAGAVLLMAGLISSWFYREMRHATLMARVGPQVSDEMRAMYASPVRIALQVLAIMGISALIGVVLGWLLDLVLS